MVSRGSFGFRQISHVVSTEVLEEVNGNLQLSVSLLVAFRASSLDSLNEKVPDFLVLHSFNDLSADFTKHKISLLVMERIVQSILWTLTKRFYESFSLIV